jgi:hypothetical protein
MSLNSKRLAVNSKLEKNYKKCIRSIGKGIQLMYAAYYCEKETT